MIPRKRRVRDGVLGQQRASRTGDRQPCVHMSFRRLANTGFVSSNDFLCVKLICFSDVYLASIGNVIG